MVSNLCQYVGPYKALDFFQAVKEKGGALDTCVFHLILNGFSIGKDSASMNQLVSVFDFWEEEGTSINFSMNQLDVEEDYIFRSKKGKTRRGSSA
jgi:hypothetical protein